MKISSLLSAPMKYSAHKFVRTAFLIFNLPARLFLILLAGLSFLISPLANAQSQLWGMVSSGGQYGAGAIFNIDASGNNETIQYSLFQHEGSHPLFTNLIQATNGTLYGMTYKGGVNDIGVLFQYNPVTSTYTKELDFDGAINGSKPLGSLIQASDDMLYGMTYKGGANDKGVLFQYDPATYTYTKKLDFDGATTGCYPHGSLIQASDGMLYGMTVQGGANDMGVLFQYNPATSTYIKKLDFDGQTNGSNTLGTLMQASDGMLYGLTCNGGANNKGVLFQYDPATSTYTRKFDFDGAANGSNPLGFLIQASNGNLYGMTNTGGANDMGVLFQYVPATSTYSRKLDFDGATNGSYPYGSLIQASDGNLYGMTQEGGAYDLGVLFQYDPAASAYSWKLDFAGSTVGSSPYGSLIQASDGNLYGMTNLGGANNIGVLFQYAPVTSICTKKFDFGAINGSNPEGSLMQASDKKFYGMTNRGGANDMGVLFQYDPVTSAYTKELDFDGTTNGSYPEGDLMQANNGNLYGMTNQGGLNDLGVLFQYNPVTFTCTSKFDFDGITNGSYPEGDLIQASDEMLYGMTNKGGTNDMGALFQYDPATSIYTRKFDFDGAINGSYPEGSLMQASDGNLYGMTYKGGANDKGVLFQYNPATSTYTRKLDFDGTTNGSYPQGSLIQASDGMLYGMTNQGGANDMGVLFQYDPLTSTYTRKSDFDGTNGSNPIGDLMQAGDGNLYGMTYAGGENDIGVLFQYNPVTSTYIKKLDYNMTNGKHPYGNLIAICMTPSVTGQPSNSTICAGDKATFSITATGMGITYQWQENGVNIPNGGIYSGTTTATLTLIGEDITKDGNQYQCIVSGTCTTVATSNAATLTINPLPDLTTNLNGIIITANQNGAAYQWVTCPTFAVASGISNNKNYTTGANGNYAVIITLNGCIPDTSVCVNVSETGISNYSNLPPQISIFPNPNKGEFTIRSISEGVYSIVNSFGQTIQSLKLNVSNNYTMNAENLSNGIYFLVGFNNNHLTKQKIVVAR